MTPQERAAKLIKQFDPLVYPFCGSGFMTHTTDPEVILMNAKKCALITVQELITERERAVKIAYAFRDKSLVNFQSKDNAGSSVAFVDRERAEEARYIGNSISGKNGLNFNEPGYWEQVKTEIEKL